MTATKNLYVFINDGGDGSYSAQYTFNDEWVAAMQEKYDNGELDYDAVGCDGDGFHYDVLTVPAECTLKSLGIHYDLADSDDE